MSAGNGILASIERERGREGKREVGREREGKREKTKNAVIFAAHLLRWNLTNHSMTSTTCDVSGNVCARREPLDRRVGGLVVQWADVRGSIQSGMNAQRCTEFTSLPPTD